MSHKFNIKCEETKQTTHIFNFIIFFQTKSCCSAKQSQSTTFPAD